MLSLALADDYSRRAEPVTAESHVLMLLATSGMMLLAGARDLMLVFLGIELMSISVYVLAGLNRRSARSAEAALKYFLLGAFSTAFLLYGIALVYGATGIDEPRRDRGRACRRCPRPELDAPHRPRAAARRLRVQGRRRAVPHVDAGRVRRRADAVHGVHGGRGEGGGVRGVRARVARGASRALFARWHAVIWWMAAVDDGASAT